MTVEITGRQQWQSWQSNLLPMVEQVQDGLWSIPVPIPDNPLRYTLVYAHETANGLVLVDAGWDSEETWKALVAGIAVTGYRSADVEGVLVTHYHADHYGLAERIRGVSGAWVAMHVRDAEVLANLPTDRGTWERRVAEQLTTHGCPEGQARAAAGEMQLGRFVGRGVPDRLLQNGQTLEVGGVELRVVWTPGHSPGHSCFHAPDRRVLFSGDHVLPRITPQVAAMDSDAAEDPLTDYLGSLERVRLADIEEVLPAHEYRFRGLASRLQFLASHHTERLIELGAAVSAHPGSTAWELCSVLTWSRLWETFSPLSQRFALGETLAHLIMLRARGEVIGLPSRPVRWYTAAGGCTW
ncbi:MBL fold metallo-hydrolase [Rhodococcus sp. JS3073]|uniref:MBL fold metallo-hydrolase n=1 Tax=Rhodococcus sp. JS3073 TaxID=3002901 RepID=UPI002285F8AF|nr:MBL fold metallo-hydrolase [Rhodococcus sp. JS3073]WAM14795.1 MBL fold metallo-hydrolase [Rhodococcus sp. JS3073]